MLEEKKIRYILVADPSGGFLSSIGADPNARQVPPLLAANGKDAQRWLSDMNQLISGVFVNPNITETNAFSVIRCSHQHRPATPVYIIHDGDSVLTADQLDQLPIQEVIKKPISYQRMLSFINPTSLFFDPNLALKESVKGSRDEIGAEVATEDRSFLPIRAEDFISGTKSFFDVYVRLGSGRFLKILQAGDSFSPERIATYLQKGVTHFYLRREAQERYLSYCDKLATTLLQKTDIPVEVKITQTLNHGEETMSFLKNHGLSETNLQYAKSFINNTQALVQQLRPDEDQFLKGFLADVASYEHGVSTSMIAAMLIQPLKISGTNPVQIIGMSCLLHDIGLYRMDAVVRDEDQSKMTADQLVEFYTHPTVGANILREIRGVDQAVIQAVVQHHERRDRSGFPERIGSGAINRVAEIVGICDEFARLIKIAKEHPEVYVLAKMESDVFPGFSDAVVKAFRMAFFLMNR